MTYLHLHAANGIEELLFIHSLPPHYSGAETDVALPFLISSKVYSNILSCPTKSTLIIRSKIFNPTTLPGPLCVFIRSPTSGSSAFAASYSSFSYFKQHIRRPHNPDIFVGFRERF